MDQGGYTAPTPTAAPQGTAPRVPKPGVQPTTGMQPAAGALTGSVLRAPPSGRVVPGVAGTSNPGGAQAPVQQGSAVGRGGRPGGMAPHSTADALAANPMHYTGQGLAQTRGWPDIRPKVIGEGPPLGAGGSLGTALGVPGMQPGTMSATPPTNRLGLPNLNTFSLTPQAAQTTPVSVFRPQSMNVTIPDAGGGFGSTGRGLGSEAPPPAAPGGNSNPGHPSNKPKEDPGEGMAWSWNGSEWVKVRRTGGAAPVVESAPSDEELDKRGFESREQYEEAVAGNAKLAAQTAQGTTEEPASDDSFEEWLKRMGDVPQLDRSALEGQIRAEDQRQAMEDSRMLQAMAEGGARAGIDAGQMVGQQGEIGHQSAVERATRGANMRLQANIQNLQNQMAAYAQRHQAALQAAEFAQNDKQRADAQAFAEHMLQLQTEAAKEMEKYQWELSKKMAATDWLGLGLSYHMQKSGDAHDAFAAYLGGGGGFGGKCDQRVKKNIRQDGMAILRALDQLTAYSFEYDLRKCDDEDGRFFGVMAQDLLRSEAGKTLVERDPAGHLYITTKRAVPFLLAVCATLRQEIATLRARFDYGKN